MNKAFVSAAVLLLLFSCSKKKDESVREPAVSGKFYPDKKNVLQRQVRQVLSKAEEETLREEERKDGGGEPGMGAREPAAVPEGVRGSALAGAWYAGTKEGLEESVDGFFGKVQSGPVPGYPIALIVPHAGLRWSGRTAAHAYSQLKGRSYARVFVVGPSHRAHFHGVSVPKATHYETPLGRVPLDTEAIKGLAEEEFFRQHATAHLQEHCIEIQLPFLQSVLPEFKLIPMLVSGLTQEQVLQVSKTLRSYLRPGDLLIASSDFTHYGPRFQYLGPPGAAFTREEAPRRLEELLKAAWAAIEEKDLTGFFEHRKETGDTICGFLPVSIVLAALPEGAVPHLLQTDTSGNIGRDYTESVSYLSAAFQGLWPYNTVEGSGGLTDEEKGDVLKLARYTVDSYVSSGTRPTPEEAGVEVTDRMKENSGVFVTLKKRGMLRGCIGTILPVKPLVKAVVDNGINASAFDRRFRRVVEEELAEIDVEVSVLTPPVAISGPEEIILGKHGVIIEKDRHSAVFLPQVAPEQGWTVEETLRHLSHKAGLGVDGWREGARFKVFEAIVFHEEE